MKRLIIPAALCCMLAACGGAKTNSQSSDNVNTAAEAQQEVKQADPYTMVDGKIFELKGNVRKCEIFGYYSDENGIPSGTKPDEETTIEFDADGKLVSHSGFEKIIRTSDGKLEKMTWFCGDFGCDFVTQYTCNSDGFVVKEKDVNLGSRDWDYELDSNNERAKATSEAQLEDGVVGRTETVYKVLARDDNGNWTKRLLIIKDGEKEMDAADFVWENINWVEIRSIEY
ncbi:MAG: hypothetical protein MJZ61_06045 [Bacteroidales bacterium]|nr:hypothetical protein [Bacteroidales bacterium]